MTIKELREKFKKRELSPTEYLEFLRTRFERYDNQVKSTLELYDSPSIVSAARVGEEQGFLAGVPGLLKDVIFQTGRHVSASSKILEGYVAPYSATVTERLLEQGAYIMGRANCDEFAMGSSTETSAYMKTTNPWDTSCVPGGSSGGSVAAVAAGFVPWALGSETGGSVRQPAAFCGVVGFKPTYGLVSRYGVIAYASSLDQVGTAARTVYDNALVFSAIAGHDTKDGTSLPVPKKDYTVGLTGKIKPGLKIGLVENAVFAHGIDPEVAQALDDARIQLEKLGAQVVRLSIPAMDYGAAVYFMVSRAEAASNLSRFDGVKYGLRAADSDTLADMYVHTRGEGFGREVKRRILIGNYVLSAGHADAYYKSAKVVQAMIRDGFMKAFQDVDLLFMPTTPVPAFKFGAFDDNRLAMDLQDYFTAPANLAGIPAIALPCGLSSGKLPLGFQLVGPELSEELLFQTGHAYEQATPWHTLHPSTYE